MVAATSNGILDQVLDPLADCLTPDVAKRILAVALEPRRQMRIDELAQKANDGLLTDEERREYADYVEAMDLIGILKATARLALSRHAS
ncbi:MAG TPA: hypothetical protein VGI40_28080 [Pirellulaceae bacterium]|jgi:hypothetical protein